MNKKISVSHYSTNYTILRNYLGPKWLGTCTYNYTLFLDLQFTFPPPHHSMLRCCECNEQTACHMLSNYNIDLGDRGVSSVPTLMAKIAGEKLTWQIPSVL